MDNPQIKLAERFGSLWNFSEPEFVGACALPSCPNKDLYNDFECWVDDFGHYFCCEEHARKYYGIKPVCY